MDPVLPSVAVGKMCEWSFAAEKAMRKPPPNKLGCNPVFTCLHIIYIYIYIYTSNYKNGTPKFLKGIQKIGWFMLTLIFNGLHSSVYIYNSIYRLIIMHDLCSYVHSGIGCLQVFNSKEVEETSQIIPLANWHLFGSGQATPAMN